MAKPQQGQKVSVEYTGRLEDGTVFDSNVDGAPLEFQLGQQQVIPGFENAVAGLEVGESVETTIAPENAYGFHRDDLMLEFGKEQFPPEMSPEVGMQVQLSGPQGQVIPATITAINQQSVTLDANHQLAGQTLIFDIKLLEVQ